MPGRGCAAAGGRVHKRAALRAALCVRGQRRCRGAQAAGAADVSGSASCVRWRAPPSSAKSSCSVGKSGAGCTVRRRPKLLRVRGPAATRLVSRAGAGADGPARLVLPRPARSRARGRAPGAREQAARRGRRPCKALSRAPSARAARGAHAQARCEPRRIPVAVHCVGAQGMHSCRCGRCAAAPGSRHSLVSHSDETSKPLYAMHRRQVLSLQPAAVVLLARSAEVGNAKADMPKHATCSAVQRRHAIEQPLCLSFRLRHVSLYQRSLLLLCV